MNKTGFKTGTIVARFGESDKHAARMALHCAIEGFAYLTLSAKYMRKVPAYRDHFSRWAGIIENKILCHLPYILNKRITALARNCGWERHNKPFKAEGQKSCGPCRPVVLSGETVCISCGRKLPAA